jgi:hypothetical protein
MNKKELLSNSVISKYVDYLSVLISGEQFAHAYQITHKSWLKNHKDKFQGSSIWSCNSLINARDKYWWFGGISENQAQLALLSQGIKTALANEDHHAVFLNTVKILDWGQVFRGCLSYVVEAHEKFKLTKVINESVALLESEESTSLDEFTKKLRMDSGMTKVYSLASHSSIIYDSRVASALTLIAYRVLSESEVQEISQFDLLAVGSAPSGNKRNRINGKSLTARKLKPGKTQARYNLIANWLLGEAILRLDDVTKTCGLWSVNDEKELLGHIEASLFMIGSDISAG